MPFWARCIKCKTFFIWEFKIQRLFYMLSCLNCEFGIFIKIWANKLGVVTHSLPLKLCFNQKSCYFSKFFQNRENDEKSLIYYIQNFKFEFFLENLWFKFQFLQVKLKILTDQIIELTYQILLYSFLAIIPFKSFV